MCILPFRSFVWSMVAAIVEKHLHDMYLHVMSASMTLHYIDIKNSK